MGDLYVNKYRIILNRDENDTITSFIPEGSIFCVDGIEVGLIILRPLKTNPECKFFPATPGVLNIAFMKTDTID